MDKRHIHTVNEGHKKHNYDFCGKSFITAQNLKKHIHTVHEGYRDYKCESCDKSFSTAVYLKKHIETIHEGKKFGRKRKNFFKNF